MFIDMRKRLRYIQSNLEDEKSTDALPIKGTLAVVDGDIDFNKTDGYIQFMNFVIAQIIALKNIQDTAWLTCLSDICTTAGHLQDSYVRFDSFEENAKDNFKHYCRDISKAMQNSPNPLPLLGRKTMTADNLMSFMEMHVQKGNWRGFYYKPDENFQTEFACDLMNQLSGLKFSKPNTVNYDISYYLRASGYHEHVHDALNIIIQTAVYAINCKSSRDRKAYEFDIQKVSNNLGYAKSIIERTEYVI